MLHYEHKVRNLVKASKLSKFLAMKDQLCMDGVPNPAGNMAEHAQSRLHTFVHQIFEHSD